MTGSALYSDPALARFYDLENGWGADFDFIRATARPGSSVLDLGCGTGELAAGLAETCRVTAVDPAPAMLDIARARDGGRARGGGGAVDWRLGDARVLDLDQRFDLVVLTGHAFQVFLTPGDQAAVLATIARHLAPGGRFLFDSRNPKVAAWRRWTPEASRRTIVDPVLGELVAWNDVRQDPATGVVTYETFYQAGDRRLAASADLRFSTQAELADLIAAAGLGVERWLGNWTGAPFTPDAPEIIPIGAAPHPSPLPKGARGQSEP
ncbi:class I SAM-dependent methyltransferase [Zavarzinia compransoris]|uniref:class I SAM-dependent methyltransferase n=1 Tax=Zavarzinia marina TaxID=2911065 RepID=UPI001F3215AA|nr:class I SAM-dependent methyltransferase [Zavarzinia marina]MCF4164537.1 class I SAM-dependent methyltransferase [Zavarzinia marina]